MWTPGMHPRCFLCLDPLDDDTIAEGTDLCIDCMRRETKDEIEEIETWQAV
jgi:hypothetical protein